MRIADPGRAVTFRAYGRESVDADAPALTVAPSVRSAPVAATFEPPVLSGVVARADAIAQFTGVACAGLEGPGGGNPTFAGSASDALGLASNILTAFRRLDTGDALGASVSIVGGVARGLSLVNRAFGAPSVTVHAVAEALKTVTDQADMAYSSGQSPAGVQGYPGAFPGCVFPVGRAAAR